ncbi:MAG: TonB-dependent receptor [Sphingomicrobium sp.]
MHMMIRQSRHWRSYMCATVAALSLLAASAHAQTSNEPADKAGPAAQDASGQSGAGKPALLDIPLEDLLTLESTSVAKKRQEVRDAAAAVTVITQDDIRRSAANSIPDLLRMAPGVEVGNLVNGKQAVAIRGFNSRASDSLLVMIDGRSIYVSTLSGVFWELLSLPLSDIERIEIIRGPGAALWGANAVNGVINIITKHSADTLGTQIAAHAGTRAQNAALSFGDRIGEDLTYRIHGTYDRDRGLVDGNGDNFTDASRSFSAGMRVDWQPTTKDAISVAAEANDVRIRRPVLRINENPLDLRMVQDTSVNDNRSANIVARWVREQSDRFDWSLQFAFDHINYQEIGDTRLHWTQGDLDMGLHWRPNDTHDFNFGFGARVIHDDLTSTPSLSLDPESATERWVSSYVQDDISLVPNRLRLTLGAKLEHNSFTGVEFQPNARLFYRPDPAFAVWASVSRAARTPSRYERGGTLDVAILAPNTQNNPSPLPQRFRLIGSANRPSAIVKAFEAGLRWDFVPGWTMDLAAYRNKYDRLPTPITAAVVPIMVPGVPFPVAIQVDSLLAGRAKASTRGGEFSLTGKIAPWWQLALSWSHFKYSIPNDPATGQPYRLIVGLNGSPRDQLKIRTGIDLPGEVSVNGSLRRVSALGVANIPAYTEVDLKVTHQPMAGLDLSLIGQNLIHKRHLEFSEFGYPAPLSYVPRSVAAEVRYRF